MFVDIAIWLCTNSISLAVFCRGVDVRLGVYFENRYMICSCV